MSARWFIARLVHLPPDAAYWRAIRDIPTVTDPASAEVLMRSALGV